MDRKIDIALATAYSPTESNESITIFEGNVEIEHNGLTLPLNGKVEFVWQRHPDITFSFIDRKPDEGKEIYTEIVNLSIPNSWGPVRIKCTRSNRINDESGSRHQFAGTVLDPIFIGNELKVSHIIFHLANFHDTIGAGIGIELDKKWLTWAGRFNLDTEEWKITVDKAEDYGVLFKKLRDFGGYGITHVIRAERRDGNEFALDDFMPVRNDLFYFFSFVRGFWTEPFLEIGYSASGEQAWERWSRPRIGRWKVVSTWFDANQRKRLSSFWIHFIQNLSHPIWGDVLKRALVWYISCNQMEGEIEGSIILAQTAHELLSWTKFTTEKGLSPGGFKDLPAMDKLRLLLNDARIPLEIPSTLKALIARSRAENWTDGAEAVTGVRNLLVHPSPKNLKRVKHLTEKEMFEAYTLTMWYLELFVLYLFGYDDHYYNRCVPEKWAGQTEPVPWIAPL